MPPFPQSPLSSVRRVFPSTAGRLAFQVVPFLFLLRLSQHQAYPVQPVGLRLPFVRSATPLLRPALCRNSGLGGALPFEESTPLPQRSSLRTGFYCPSPSTLNRPHPSHSQAHPDFTALRFIRDALAVLVRLGDPRVVPCFHCTFLLGMPSSTATGSPSAVLTQSFTDDIGLRQEPTARHSQSCPSSASDGRRVFAASLVRFRYSLSSCSSPWRI
jgi:hypothetical protein